MRRWANLYALVFASDGTKRVGDYVAKHGDAGLKDLERALGLGSGAVRELLREGHRMHEGRGRGWLGAGRGFGYPHQGR